MSFSTLSYAGFLIVVWLATALLRRSQARQALLLLASYLFYLTWSPPFLLLLAASSTFNLLWGRLLRRDPRSSLLATGVLLNLIPLLLFKYGSGLTSGLWQGGELEIGWLVPVGISFYTFQAVSFLFDVYRGYGERPGWLEFFLYLAFWPTILSGPICRAPEMLPQFRQVKVPETADVRIGLNRILLGLFMKVVLADTLASGASGRGIVYGFDHISSGWSAFDSWALAVGYGFQLFFDFAGYSHMAIGSARLFGIRLRENFDAPYRARSLAEFWRRWHMSLSSWIRDYIFFPLAGWKRSRPWSLLFLVFSMVVFGVWHGATWCFLVWGLYQGGLLALPRLRGGAPSRSAAQSVLSRAIGWGGTMLAVSLGWLVFRAESLSQSAGLIVSLIRFDRPNLLPADFHLLTASFVALTVLWVLLGRPMKLWLETPLGQEVTGAALPVCRLCMILLVIIWSDEASPFVYVRF